MEQGHFYPHSFFLWFFRRVCLYAYGPMLRARCEIMEGYRDRYNSPDVEDAMDALREHGSRVAMDATELAVPLAAAAAAEVGAVGVVDDDDELDDFMAAHLALPAVVAARVGPTRVRE